MPQKALDPLALKRSPFASALRGAGHLSPPLCIDGDGMIETSVEYLGGLRFAVTARGHRVICDQPAGAQGTDGGMTPPEFLLASLGACAGVYAAGYLRARSLPAEGLAVRVVAEKSLGPARLSAFRIEITAPGLEDERHRAGILRAAKACLIHNTLMQPPSIEVLLASPVEAGVS